MVLVRQLTSKLFTVASLYLPRQVNTSNQLKSEAYFSIRAFSIIYFSHVLKRNKMWSVGLSGNKSFPSSSTFLSILAENSNLAARRRISNSSNLDSSKIWNMRIRIMSVLTLTLFFIFHILHVSQARSSYFSNFSLSFNVNIWHSKASTSRIGKSFFSLFSIMWSE